MNPSKSASSAEQAQKAKSKSTLSQASKSTASQDAKQPRKKASKSTVSQATASSKSSASKDKPSKPPKRGSKPPPPKVSPVMENILNFFLPPAGLLRILRMVFIIGAVVFLSLAEAHDSYIIYTILETFIIFVFIIIYMLTLHHLLLTLDWPLFDIINSTVTGIFLLVVFILALLEQERKPIFYTGGILSFAAAVVCFVDAFFVTKNTKNKVRKALGFKDEPEKVTITPAAASLKEPTMEPSKASSPTSSKAASAGPSGTLLQAPSVKSVSRAPSVKSASRAPSAKSLSRAPSAKSASRAPSAKSLSRAPSVKISKA